jgi:hypothetical protein
MAVLSSYANPDFVDELSFSKGEILEPSTSYTDADGQGWWPARRKNGETGR